MAATCQKPGLGFRPSSQDLLKLSQIQSLVDHIDVAIQDLEDGNGGQVGRRHDVALPTVDHDRERRDTLMALFSQKVQEVAPLLQASIIPPVAPPPDRVRKEPHQDVRRQPQEPRR